jgi:hypothetical protein
MPIRPRGVAFSMPDRRSSVSNAVIGVIVAPGATALTVMCFLASSFEKPSVSALTAAFDAE